MTANLFHGNAKPEAIVELLEAQKVDVACFQELVPAQAEAIARVMPHGKLSPRDDHDGHGVALRNPGQVEPFPLPHRTASVVRLQPEDWPKLEAVIEVIGLHFQAPHAKGPPWRTFPIRRAQCHAFLAYLKSAPAAHRVVAGDFNATPIWPLYRRLAEQLVDAPLAFARGQGRQPSRTWGPPDWQTRLLRIDHVFTEGLQVTHSEVLPVEGSDHSAVVADLELA